MNLESLRDCIGAYGGSKEGIVQGLVLCLEPWRFVVLVVVFAAVSVVLSLLLARRDRARREDAELSDKELESRTKEMQKKWHRGLFGV